MDNLAEAKKSLRKKQSALRAALTENQRQELEKIALSTLFELDCIKNANTLLCYFPVGSEPNILPIVEKAQLLGKTIAFPISHTLSHTITFHKVTSISELIDGAYGIKEPKSTMEQITTLTNTVCIVPALAYNENGYRLGYGGGYYDRFLSGYTGTSVLIIHSTLLVNKLPTDKYDLPTDIIITEKGVTLFNEK